MCYFFLLKGISIPQKSNQSDPLLIYFTFCPILSMATVFLFCWGRNSSRSLSSCQQPSSLWKEGGVLSTVSIGEMTFLTHRPAQPGPVVPPLPPLLGPALLPKQVFKGLPNHSEPFGAHADTQPGSRTRRKKSTCNLRVRT